MGVTNSAQGTGQSARGTGHRARRRASVRTYAGQPIRPIVARLQAADVSAQQVITNLADFLGRPVAVCPPRAGAKTRAHLRAAMIDAGPVASRVIDALTDGRGSSAMVADGTLGVSPAMADALIELFTLVARERRPEDAA